MTRRLAAAALIAGALSGAVGAAPVHASPDYNFCVEIPTSGPNSLIKYCVGDYINPR